MARRGGGERGSVLPLVALAMVAVIAMASLAIDVGNAMLHKRRLQAAADLAALAGAQKLPDPAAASVNAKDLAARNWAAQDRSAISTSVSTGCRTAGCSAPDKVTVDAAAQVPTGLARIFGIKAIPVHAHAAACGPCETSTRKFDVMVVLDRSYSMCLDSKGAYNSCYDLEQARAGVRSLLGVFDPKNDRVGLAVLSSADSVTPFSHAGAAAPCDTADVGDSGGSGTFAGTLGDFMDGTAAAHDPWVVAGLASDFKKADGSLNASSSLVSTLTCLKPKFWTPIAPAIQAANDELAGPRGRRGQANVTQVIVFLSDGGANVQPMKRDSKGNATTTRSWYTPSAGNDLRPCHDAVGQAAAAKAAEVEVYTIGYDLNASSANLCYSGNKPNVPADVETGIDARGALQQMATDPSHFKEKSTPGELESTFAAIGRQIVVGGSRLVE